MLIAPCLEQIRWNSSEHCSEAPSDAQQVFSAHRDDISRLLPALETAWSVSLHLQSQCTTVLGSVLLLLSFIDQTINHYNYIPCWVQIATLLALVPN